MAHFSYRLPYILDTSATALRGVTGFLIEWIDLRALFACCAEGAPCSLASGSGLELVLFWTLYEQGTIWFHPHPWCLCRPWSEYRIPLTPVPLAHWAPALNPPKNWRKPIDLVRLCLANGENARFSAAEATRRYMSSKNHFKNALSIYWFLRFSPSKIIDIKNKIRVISRLF